MSHESFEDYLKQRQLRESTVKGHLQDIRRFKKWCEGKSINYKQTTYNELLEFIRNTRARGVSKSSVNIHLNSIGKYYDYLIVTGQKTVTSGGDEANPAKELRLNNRGKKVMQHLLAPRELEDIYDNYTNKPEWSFYKEKSKHTHRKNTVILGLIVYQGIRTPELRKLEKTHLNLLQGTVYIPSTSRSNSRILKLNSSQIIPIQQYLQSIQKNQERLFTVNISNSMFWLMKILKKHDDRIKNGAQLRSSVIMNWLKQQNIRQVQYMAGHRHISSTEKYKQEDLQDLQLQLNLFHPLK